MSVRILAALAAYGIVSLTPSTARAQDVPLSELLVDLIQSDIRLAPPAVGLNHEAHFIPGVNQEIAPYFFNQQLIVQLGTFPIGSPSGGFSYMFDSATGTFQRATQSFGPAFAERSQTVGRNRVTVGFNYQYSRYSSFEGEDLDNGDIKFYLRHAPASGLFFEGDVIEAALRLEVSSSTTTFFANYGLTDQWDLAVAVPIQRVSMDAAVDATVLRLATGATSTVHVFPNGTTTETFTSEGDASGIGDVLVRTKYRFLDTPGGGLAVGLDVRLPSGDVDNLLGTGATQATVSLIGSTTNGNLSPHFNVGYTGSSSGDTVGIPNEFAYKIGTELIANPRVTLSADLIGRTLFDAGRLEFEDNTHTYMDFNLDPQSVVFTELNSTDKSLNLTNLAVGGKVNVAGNLLINANLLFALNSRGLTARVTPIIGLDYSF